MVVFFSNQNNLYRVNQIHDKEHYGKSFGINKIKCLNENEYVESRISNVDPSFKKILFPLTISVLMVRLL